MSEAELKTMIAPHNNRIVIVANTSWYIYNFRLSLIKRLQHEGFTVCVVAPEDEFSAQLRQEGCEFLALNFASKSINLFREFKTLLDFRRVYAILRPCVILHYTPKPNIYGSLAARWLRIPCINNIAGLGTAFINNKSFLSLLLRQLYKLSQRYPSTVFFQNPDDKLFFETQKIVKEKRTVLLPGSGVDNSKFVPQPQAESSKTTFLLIARLIWDKGVGEFAEAARMFMHTKHEVQFQLLGFIDTNNPKAVPEEQITAWEKEGILTWLGRTEDVRPYIAQSDCVVLPSYYREGTPKSLLEAASMGKPLITTDAIGCRETVDNGVTGFLCKPRDAQDLAVKMEKFLDMDSSERQQMGRKGREKMIREFDEEIVLNKYFEAINYILSGNDPVE